MKKKTPKILVVDDEPDITASFQSYFGRRGFLVNTTASGKDALKIIKSSRPDLVFLDLTLPEIDGKEVLKELRRYDQKTKVIIVTGHILDSDKEEKEFSSLGVTAYFNKPINLEELNAVVKKVLKDQFFVKDTKRKKTVKKEEKSFSSMNHKLRNLLGNMKNECEIYLLNKKDGIYDEKSEKELAIISEDIIKDVIKTVDDSIQVLEQDKE